MTEYIITRNQVEGIAPYLYAEKAVPSWLAFWAKWDVSNDIPLRKDEGLAVGLPEIVRCRDCVHFERTAKNGICHRSKFLPMWAEPNGFCAWASRKEVCE